MASGFRHDQFSLPTVEIPLSLTQNPASRRVLNSRVKYAGYRRNFGCPWVSQKASAPWDRIQRRRTAIPRHKHPITLARFVFLNQPCLHCSYCLIYCVSSASSLIDPERYRDAGFHGHDGCQLLRPLRWLTPHGRPSGRSGSANSGGIGREQFRLHFHYFCL